MTVITDCKHDLYWTSCEHTHGKLRPLIFCLSKFRPNARLLFNGARMPLHHTRRSSPGRASFRKIDISTPQSIFRNCPFATSVILTRSLIPRSNTRCRSSKVFGETLLLLSRLLPSISLTNGSSIHLSTDPDRASSRIESIRQGSDELDSCDWLCGHSGSIQGGPDWHL